MSSQIEDLKRLSSKIYATISISKRASFGCGWLIRRDFGKMVIRGLPEYDEVLSKLFRLQSGNFNVNARSSNDDMPSTFMNFSFFGNNEAHKLFSVPKENTQKFPFKLTAPQHGGCKFDLACRTKELYSE